MIEDCKKKYEAVGRKQRTFPRINLDLKLLVETHGKLAAGAYVEPNVVNMLLLSGVRNVLCQSEEFDEALEKIKVLEANNTETKFRLESLETWVLKLNDKVENVTAKIETDENHECSEHLKDQVETLSKEIFSLKETITLPATLKTTSPLKNKSCNKCGETFARNYELETHMFHMHELEKTSKCEICGKSFYLEWRLKKHGSNHTGSSKPCKSNVPHRVGSLDVSIKRSTDGNPKFNRKQFHQPC